MKLSCSELRCCFLRVCLFVGTVKASDLICEYKNYNNGYTCIILARQIIENETIQIVGEHLSEMSDLDVQSAAFYGSGMRNIPKNLFQTFQNLNRLDVQVSHVEFIDGDSFQGASNLKQLWATSNFVRRLEGESFGEAFKLQIIDLRSNLISFVDEKAFKNLTKLEKLLLSQNDIVELSKDSFIDLLSLKLIHLHSNMIEALEEGYYKNAIKLEEISLNNNRVKIIAADLFNHLGSLSLLNFCKNVCISIDKIYGMETPIPLLIEDIKKCTQENTSEAKNKILSEKLQESEETIIILTDDMKDLNSAYNWKLVEITKTKKINENLEKSLNRYVKVSEVCENKNQKLENDLKRAFHLLSKGNT